MVVQKVAHQALGIGPGLWKLLDQPGCDDPCFRGGETETWRNRVTSSRSPSRKWRSRGPSPRWAGALSLSHCVVPAHLQGLTYIRSPWQLPHGLLALGHVPCSVPSVLSGPQGGGGAEPTGRPVRTGPASPCWPITPSTRSLCSLCSITQVHLSPLGECSLTIPKA